MARILIVCDNAALVQAQTETLERAGHRVEVAADTFRARDRLSGEACDLVVIDVRSPDGGMGLLIEQARAAWPGCAVVAQVLRADLRRTKVHEMGLWTPDAALIHPVSAEDLLGTVSTLSDRHAGAAPTGREGAAL